MIDLEKVITKVNTNVDSEEILNLKKLFSESDKINKNILTMMCMLLREEPTIVACSPKIVAKMLHNAIILGFKIGQEYGKAEIMEETFTDDES